MYSRIGQGFGGLCTMISVQSVVVWSESNGLGYTGHLRWLSQ